MFQFRKIWEFKTDLQPQVVLLGLVRQQAPQDSLVSPPVVNQLVQMEIVNSFRGRTKAEAKGDNVVDVVEDVANNSNNIRFRQLVSPNSISFNLNWIQLQQFNKVAKVKARVENSRVVMAAMVIAVVDVECAGYVRVQGTLSECAHGWRRLQCN